MQNFLSANFLRYFDVALATTADQKAKVFGIRYSVYCDEFNYEPAHLFPDHQEKDDFDTNSLHALITHKSSGMPAGCVRLVRPTYFGDVDQLPLEKNCSEALDRVFIRELDLERNTVCEISRLAVDGMFRRRAGESMTRFGEVTGLDCTQQERRTFSMVAVAGFLAATALTEIADRRNVFAMMEPFLPRLLERSGIVFRRAGRDIDHHGQRAPYFIRSQLAVSGMRPDLRELYDEILRRIRLDYDGELPA